MGRKGGRARRGRKAVRSSLAVNNLKSLLSESKGEISTLL